MIEIASPEDDLVGLAYDIDRHVLAAGELFAILVGQHLQFKLISERACLGTQVVDAMQTVVALTRVRVFSSGTGQRGANNFAIPWPVNKRWMTSNLN